jgi:hypothetical protein
MESEKNPKTKFKNPRRSGNEQFLSSQERIGEVTKEQPIFFRFLPAKSKKFLF